jgi:hypothetical protein
LTRQWLNASTGLPRPRFAAIGSPLPDEIAVSCGWPSQNGRARRNRVIGECWKVDASAAGRPEILVSPMLADSVEVSAVLAPELIHAAHPDAGHKGPFKRCALALGLSGRMTATVPGDQLHHDLVALTEQIGQPYPHAEIHAPAEQPKQSTRMLKLQCPGCEYVVRTTRTWLEVGIPVCCCGEDFEVSP